MPFLDLFSQYLIHQPMLLNDRETLELLGDDVESVHGTAATANVLDLFMTRSVNSTE